jgi:polyhydroxybutyrate depolymerase
MQTDSIRVDGNYRVFHFNKPAMRNASLVFVLHGSGGSASNMMKAAARLQAKAQDENIILVYPEGYKHFWNECRKEAMTVANKENIDENTFFGSMIMYFKKNYRVDREKIFGIGFSGGGHMMYKFGLTMPDEFKAVAAVVASLPSEDNLDCAQLKKPIAIMIANGTADKTNPYSGGEMRSGKLAMGKVRSTDETFNYWATLAGHSGQPVKTELPNSNHDNITIEKYSFESPAKPDVTLLKVINGKHELPTDIDVFLESWEFFKRQMSKK